MATALCLSIQNCGSCKQFEAKCQLPEMEPIMCTQPVELVHVDYVGVEVTIAAKEKPGGEECTGGGGSLYPLCSGLRHEQPYGLHHGSSLVQQLLLCLRLSAEIDVGSRNRVHQRCDCHNV